MAGHHWAVLKPVMEMMKPCRPRPLREASNSTIEYDELPESLFDDDQDEDDDIPPNQLAVRDSPTFHKLVGGLSNIFL